MMGSFSEFLESVVSDEYISNLPMKDRLRLGRDRGETFIRDVLKKHHGIDIEPSRTYRTDAVNKIDGFYEGQPVQIKLRRTGTSDDIAFEVLQNHEFNRSILDQLENRHQRGRDYKGTTVHHYFVMNRDETKIYHFEAKYLKVVVDQALRELGKRTGGKLQRAFRSKAGVELRPTVDRDPESYTHYKVMAFIPVEILPKAVYNIPTEPRTLQRTPSFR